MQEFNFTFNDLTIPKQIKKDLDTDSKTAQIIVRFPPEPSGYLHIGHAKALHTNASIAKHYKGKLIIRFDDTNPETESIEYHDAIIEDLNKLGCDVSDITYVSDYFDQLINIATDLIKSNNAFVDFSTDIEKQRDYKSLAASPYRDTSIEENLIHWNNMINGEINNACLRFKISPFHQNSAMRDPVMYRSIDLNHFRTNNKYKIYPSYDYSCPIVDALQGVTHVFRSTEYIERKDQTIFILKKLNMKVPRIYHYGRVNIIGAELSKRKIKDGIEKGLYNSWDDHRLYTIRALYKRGFTGSGIENFMVDLGYSTRPIEISHQKLLNCNFKNIDKLAIRCIALPLDYVIVLLEFNDGDFPIIKTLECVPRNSAMGTRTIVCNGSIAIKKEDYNSMMNGEEITLTTLGNAFFRNGKFITNFNGDPKNTRLKIIWIASDDIGICHLKITKLNSDGNKTILTYLGEKYILNIPVNSYVYLNQMENYLVLSNDGVSNVELLEIDK